MPFAFLKRTAVPKTYVLYWPVGSFPDFNKISCAAAVPTTLRSPYFDAIEVTTGLDAVSFLVNFLGYMETESWSLVEVLLQDGLLCWQKLDCEAVDRVFKQPLQRHCRAKDEKNNERVVHKIHCRM